MLRHENGSVPDGDSLRLPEAPETDANVGHDDAVEADPGEGCVALPVVQWLQMVATTTAHSWSLFMWQCRTHRSAGPDEDDEDDEVGDPYLLPVTHEVAFEGVHALLMQAILDLTTVSNVPENDMWVDEVLHIMRHQCVTMLLGAGHEKLVTTLDVDRAGARALTGGEDYQLRMFDFGGMKRDMRAFRKLEPSEGYPVNAVSFSPTGEGSRYMCSANAVHEARVLYETLFSACFT